MNNKKENKGYIHLYTGNGKGKTTAALGLALRAAGAGKSVYIAQFVKGMHYSELNSIKQFKTITLKQYGRNCFIEREPAKEDIEAAQNGLKDTAKVLAEGKYDMLILDEITIALYYKLISIDAVLTLIKSKPASMELIMTGRKASKELQEMADLITEMKEVKHYYNEGVEAREGIEY